MKVMLDDGAYMPERAHDLDAGYDLRTPVNVQIAPRRSVTIDTGVHIQIPEGYVGFLKSKSGLNVRHNIHGEGVIDAGYTGSIVVKLDEECIACHPHSQKSLGARIAVIITGAIFKRRLWQEITSSAVRQKGEPMNNKLSVANDIKALALINIQDIFRFMITATDDEITERYGSEARAIEIADKYLDIAFRVDFIQDSIKGWSMTYTQPIKDSDERREYKAYFYDTKDSKSEGET